MTFLITDGNHFRRTDIEGNYKGAMWSSRRDGADIYTELPYGRPWEVFPLEYTMAEVEDLAARGCTFSPAFAEQFT